jgi:hypothetical protein
MTAAECRMIINPGNYRMTKIALTLLLLTTAPLGAMAQAQAMPYQRTPQPAWAPHAAPLAAPPGSQPNMLISPPPASWQGQWRPEYGAMIAPPWVGVKQ